MRVRSGGLKGFSLFALFAYLAAGNFAIIMAGASLGLKRSLSRTIPKSDYMPEAGKVAASPA